VEYEVVKVKHESTSVWGWMVEGVQVGDVGGC